MQGEPLATFRMFGEHGATYALWWQGLIPAESLDLHPMLIEEVRFWGSYLDMFTDFSVPYTNERQLHAWLRPGDGEWYDSTGRYLAQKVADELGSDFAIELRLDGHPPERFRSSNPPGRPQAAESARQMVEADEDFNRRAEEARRAGHPFRMPAKGLPHIPAPSAVRTSAPTPMQGSAPGDRRASTGPSPSDAEIARRNREVRTRMADLYVPVTDRGSRGRYVNLLPWWRDPLVLSGIGQLLATPFIDERPTVVIGPAASGYLLGALVATFLDVGLGAVRKNPVSVVDSDPWWTATTPPDYQDRHLVLGLRRGTLSHADRVLAVDDVADTGSQLLALQRIVKDAGAHWVGASVTLDLLDRNSVRRDLNLKTVFHDRELP